MGGKARCKFRCLPGKSGGKCRRDFLVGETFVSLDGVLEEELEAFFKGRKDGKSVKIKCFRCGTPVHMAKDCSSLGVCFNCGGPGHRQDSCPTGARAGYTEEIYCPSFVGHHLTWSLAGGGNFDESLPQELSGTPQGP